VIRRLLVHTTLARGLHNLVGTKLAEEFLVHCVLRAHSTVCSARRRYQRAEAEVAERFGFNLVTRLRTRGRVWVRRSLPPSIRSPKIVQHLGSHGLPASVRMDGFFEPTSLKNGLQRRTWGLGLSASSIDSGAELVGPKFYHRKNSWYGLGCKHDLDQGTRPVLQHFSIVFLCGAMVLK
jgi:hypothetical protein